MGVLSNPPEPLLLFKPGRTPLLKIPPLEHADGLDQLEPERRPVLALWTNEGQHLFEILGAQLLVGSWEEADITIDADGMEAHHLSIVPSTSGVLYEALDGTTVLDDGSHLRGRRLLPYGDKVVTPGATIAVYRSRAEVPEDVKPPSA